MNWDAIGAIAELLGAIGVIASLVYLATQIRQSREQIVQNTRATQAASYQQLNESIGGRMSLPPADRDVVRRGSLSFRELDEEDAFSFGVWALGVVMDLESSHYQYRMGSLDEDRWRLHRSVLWGFLQSPGFSEWWRTNPAMPDLSPEFVALVEDLLAEKDPAESNG